MSATAANQIRAAALKAARAKDSQRKRQRTVLLPTGCHGRSQALQQFFRAFPRLYLCRTKQLRRGCTSH